MESAIVTLAVIFVLILFIFYIIVAIEFSNIAVLKGYPEKKTKALFFCLLVPFAGYLYVCALPDNRVKDTIRSVPDIEDSLPEL